ncbi:MAG TPA: glycosyltransferase [Acidimicrobiales bacterium]|nr:glycosyltransferase [Acidimicrobiales bacterium]
MGKTAKFLERLGHEVWVVTAAGQPLEPTLDVEVDPARVLSTRWLNVGFVAESALGGRGQVVKAGFSAGGRKGAALRSIIKAARSTVVMPDPQIGWYPYAVRDGVRWLAEARPDVIFASAGPYTSLLAGQRIARKLDVPWVAGFRDLWVDNPYREVPKARRLIEGRLERRTVSSASALVTVSEPLADTLRSKYDIPVAVVTNGYDEDDLQTAADATPSAGGRLLISYTGTIVPGRRDPTPLFRAVKSLGLTSDDIRMMFVGRYMDIVTDLSEAEGVASMVEVREPVSHHDAVRLQRESDVLLLLLWDDPRERGVVTGKLFEYLGARRPVLLLGADTGVAASLVTERHAGIATTDPAVARASLERWLQQKREGGVPGVPSDRLTDLTREHQTGILADILDQAVRAASTRR